ncbi:MAG: hypothetical protein ACTSRU_04515, partial [Candidatus Hodarchaeales archaeon]
MFKRFIEKKNNKKQNIKNLEKKIQELEEENIRELKRIKKLMETNRKSEALDVARRYKLRLQTIKNIKKIISTLEDNYAMVHSTMEMASTDLFDRQIKLDNNLDSEQEFKISLEYDTDINIKPDDLEELEEIISLAMDDQSIVRTPPLDEMDKELDSLLKILAEDETDETPAIEPDPAIISGAVAPSPSPVDAEMETETESAVSPAKMRSGPVPEPAPRMVPEVEPVTADDSEPTGELALEAEPAPP